MERSGSDRTGTAVVLCSCGGRLPGSETAAVAKRLAFGGLEPQAILSLDALCAEAGLEAVRAFAAKRGASALVCAGCSPAASHRVLDAVAGTSGISPSALTGVPLGAGAEPDAREIRKAVAALAAAPRFQTREYPLGGAVLVVGQGEPARLAAARLHALGHRVTLLGDQADDASIASLPSGRLDALDGHVGDFRARIGSPAGATTVSCGAVLVAAGLQPSAAPAARISRRFPSPPVLALPALESAAAALPREPRVRSLGIVLDLDTEESRAGTSEALESARRLQRAGATQVYLFAHDMRVAAPGLQELYDEVRASGVVIVKYDGKLAIRADASGARLDCRDAGLGADSSYACDLVGVSAWGVLPGEGADLGPLADALGVSRDCSGRLQENNIHLLPVLTSRAGVYVAGSPRGQHFLPDALQEVEAAVAAIHALLQPGSLAVELSHAVVDEDKCALCLTCVRACPHHAMGIDMEKKVAAADPVACRKCGICAGECPAKAISLPAWSDAAVLVQLGGAR